MKATAKLIQDCKNLLQAFENGDLGQTLMPEDSSPVFSKEESELRLAYFSLPMSLNYQRDSYKLWEASLKTYSDTETKKVFDIEWSSNANTEELKELLLRYKVALQPNKHINTWQKISQTVFQNWGSFSNLLNASDHDFLKLKNIMQKEYKNGFPYLSGPKIFNYWSFIIQKYGKVTLNNSKHIDIAPDTHITKCSVLLNVITEEEALILTRDQISEKWRLALQGSGINPIQMHPPLWFWSRNGFIYKLPRP